MKGKSLQIVECNEKAEKPVNMKSKNGVSVVKIKDAVYFLKNFEELKRICRNGNRNLAIEIKEGKILTWKK